MAAGLDRIKSVPDVFRDSINEHMNAAAKKFKDSIRPIYGTTDRGTAIHIGSCTLLRLMNTELLLTAAHIIDDNKHTSLYIAGETKLVLIAADFVGTKKIDGSRDKDHFDFAITKLPKKTVDALGNVRFVSEQDVSVAQAEPTGHVFMAMGCPHSKNKKIDNITRKINATIWKYAATAAADETLAKKLRVTGKEHLFIKFNKKHSQNQHGIRVNSVNPRGISGGGLFDLGNLADPWSLEKTADRKACLAGLLIELPTDQNLMVATRISAILEALKRGKWL